MLNKIFCFMAFTLFISCVEMQSPTGLDFSENTFKRLDALSANEVPLNYQTLKNYIIKPHCIRCHEGASAKPEDAPVDLSSYETITADQFVPILKKGDAVESRFYQEVLSGSMPEVGNLNAAELDFVKRWIDACAPKELVLDSKCNTPTDDDEDDDDGDWDDDWDDEEFK